MVILLKYDDAEGAMLYVDDPDFINHLVYLDAPCHRTKLNHYLTPIDIPHQWSGSSFRFRSEMGRSDISVVMKSQVIRSHPEPLPVN